MHSKKCNCRGCGRSGCSVGYGGSLSCINPLRKRGWAAESGHCTSCVCSGCGAYGRPCYEHCEWHPHQLQLAALPPIPVLPPIPAATQLPGLAMPQSMHHYAASSQQPQPQIYQHIGELRKLRIQQPPAFANLAGPSQWAEPSGHAGAASTSAWSSEPSGQPVAAATAASPPEEEAAPEPTIADLYAFIQELYRRLSIVEEDLAKSRGLVEEV